MWTFFKDYGLTFFPTYDLLLTITFLAFYQWLNLVILLAFSFEFKWIAIIAFWAHKFKTLEIGLVHIVDEILELYIPKKC
jgi:hypothetical protein